MYQQAKLTQPVHWKCPSLCMGYESTVLIADWPAAVISVNCSEFLLNGLLNVAVFSCRATASCSLCCCQVSSKTHDACWEMEVTVASVSRPLQGWNVVPLFCLVVLCVIGTNGASGIAVCVEVCTAARLVQCDQVKAT